MKNRRSSSAKNYEERVKKREQIMQALGFDRKPLNQKEFIECRAPSCDKKIQREFTRNGYCMSCVNKAVQLKAERERLKIIERESVTYYDNDGSYGVF